MDWVRSWPNQVNAGFNAHSMSWRLPKVACNDRFSSRLARDIPTRMAQRVLRECYIYKMKILKLLIYWDFLYLSDQSIIGATDKRHGEAAAGDA